MKYPIAKALQKYAYSPFSFAPPLLWLNNQMTKLSQHTQRCPKALREHRIIIAQNGNEAVEVTFIEPRAHQGQRACLLYIHGGAFALESGHLQKRLAYAYAQGANCVVVLARYRLLPKHAFPAGFNDCCAIAEWLFTHAADYNIDPQRIAIAGDSAGGNLAAALTLKRRDQQQHPFCCQMLIYPVLDARQTSESMQNFSDTPIWNTRLNAQMWQRYLQNGVAPTEIAYASPAQAQTLTNLPATYIEVAEFDCLRDEGIAYAHALAKAGVKVELNETKATIHGYELAFTSDLVQTAIQRRVAYLNTYFHLKGDRNE